MKRDLQRRSVLCLVLLPLAFLAALAQEPPPPEADDEPAAQELRQAIREFFENRLREELALTDDQMTAIRPLVEEIEQSRAQTRRERARAVRSLRAGLREGMSDAELQRWLDRLDSLEVEQRERERAVTARIDERLSVRQRVQFRFFTEAFRRKMEERIRALREEREPPPRRAPLDRRPPPPPRP